jgi:DNA polymerase-3 subunit beta
VAAASEIAASLTMTQRALRHLFAMVHFAMAQQDIRYYLNGLLLVVAGPELRAVATDGHRLAYCLATPEGMAETGQHEVIIPRKTIAELQRLLADNEEPVQIDIAARQIRFRFGQVDLLSKLVEGRFPDYQRVIPTQHTRQTTVNRESLASALTRASILTSEKFKGIRLILSTGLLKIQTTNTEQEEASEEIDVDYIGDELDIGFNVTYLLDVLANLKTETVRLEFGDANSSMLLCVPEEAGFKYVVMPMRI